MAIRRLTLILGLALLAGSTGCTPLGALVLEAEDDGSAVAIEVGERINVKLASNVSTGYAWELAELDETVLENTDQRYVAGFTLFPVEGAGGTEIWEFTAIAPGTTTLRLEYNRPDSGEEPDGEFEVEVTVAAAE
jgi:inhibitor of cysteine peptidase